MTTWATGALAATLSPGRTSTRTRRAGKGGATAAVAEVETSTCAGASSSERSRGARARTHGVRALEPAVSAARESAAEEFDDEGQPDARARSTRAAARR